MEKIDISYQKEAIWGCKEEAQEGLLKITNKYLVANVSKNNFPEVILKAITGAGKTIIMADYINKVLEQDDRPDIIFVWLSIGTSGLQFQSAEKIKPLLSSEVTKIICPKEEKDFNETSFSDGNLLILNWEKINNSKKDELVSNLMTGEKHNLKKAVENTDDKARFIMLIDEFHLNYQTDAYVLIMNLFKPTMILGMTATPKPEQLANKRDMHNIPTAKVRESGMIKKGTYFNQDLDEIVLNEDNNNGLNEEIIKLAIKKRMTLEKAYRDEDEDSNVIPLCLIQVPNNDKEFLESITSFLSSQKDNDKDITANEDYICWMSDVSKNATILELIKNIDSNEVKYLIFKQAIATGWDCPRAHILVKFRPLKKDIEPFDLQTIGRVLRMPERHFYKNDDLNYAYIYAPEKKFNYDEQVEEALGNIETKNQKIVFTDDVNLLEEFLESMQLEEIPLIQSEIKKVFLEVLEVKFNTAKANKEFREIHIFNTSIETNDALLDGMSEEDISSGDTVIEYNTVQLDRRFNTFLSSMERPFLKKNNLKNWLYKFFKDKLSLDLDNEDDIIEIIKNCLMYEATIQKAILETSNRVHQKTERKQNDNKPFEFLRNPKYLVDKVDKRYKKCIYKPCINNGFSDPEKIFIQELEKNPTVKWWYKNNDKGENALCVVYIEDEGVIKGKSYKVLAPTFPDFVVFFEDKNSSKKSIGIYETKDADKIEPVNDRKHSAIKDYITSMKDKADKKSVYIDKVYGGVVKIKNYNTTDDDGNLVGEIDNKTSYPELIVKD